LSAAERTSFVEEVTLLVAGGMRVVLGLRADFYGEALRFPALAAALAGHQVIVGPMTVDELRSAVVQPARLASIELEPGLVDMVLDDLVGGRRGAEHDPGALPLLAHSLYETWRLGGGRRLTLAHLVESGGIGGAVSATAERLHAGLSDRDALAARRLFLRLVHVGQDVADTRRRASREELAALAPDSLIESLIEARLVTADDTSVQIAHESLISAWPRLREWIDEDRDRLLVHRELAASAAAWVRAGHDPGMLYRSGRLEHMRAWSTDPDHRATLTHQERAFLEASTAAVREHERAALRQTRRLRTLVASLTVLVLAVVGVSGYTWRLSARAGDERDLAVSRQLAEASSRIRASDPTAAAQLAVLSYRTAPTAEARGALLDSSAVPLSTRVEATGTLPTLSLSGDGRVMASGSGTGEVRVWALSDELEPQLLETAAALAVDDDAVRATALDGDGTLLAAAGAASGVHLWDLGADGGPAHRADLVGPRGAVSALAFSPDGSMLAAVGDDPALYLWDLEDPAGTAPQVLDGPEAGLTSLAFSPDGSTIAAGSADRGVYRWSLLDDPATVVVLPPLESAAGGVTSVAFAPDGLQLVAGSKDQDAWTWSLVGPHEVPTESGVAIEGAGSWVNAVGYSPDGILVATGSSDHHLRIYERSTGVLVSDIPHPGPVTNLAFLPTGGGLVTTGPDGSLRLWAEPTPSPALTGGRAFSVHFSPDGELVVAGAANEVRFFDVSHPHRATALGPATSAPDSHTFDGTAAYSPSGELLATGSAEGPVWLWAVSGGSMTLLSTMPDPPEALVEGVVFSPDGRTLAAAGDDSTVRLWDVTDPGRPVTQGVIDSPNALELWSTFSPDGDVLAVGGADPDVVTLWDVSDPATPTMLGEPLDGLGLQAHGMIFNPAGTLLAVTSADRTVRLADVSDPQAAHWVGAPLRGSGDYVYDVDFTPDGRTLAAVSGDGILRTWDVTDPLAPVLTASLTAADAGLYSISISPDGTRVAAGGVAPTVTVWDLDPAEVTSRICRLVGTPLTEEEWLQYVPSVEYQDPCGGSAAGPS
uniref:WD40 repeat domain-containing protein n=1 Tax=Actinotalea sp. TaxID=1872145 RepID=UPI0035623783